MTKVWNISDHPGTDIPPKSMVLFGSVVKPGESAPVPDDRVPAAEKMGARKDIHFGPALPADYLYAKGAYKAERMPRAVPGHVAPKGNEKPVVTKTVKASKTVKIDTRVKEPATEDTESKARKLSKR